MGDCPDAKRLVLERKSRFREGRLGSCEEISRYLWRVHGIAASESWVAWVIAESRKRV